MHTDPLADILRALRLMGGVFLEAELAAPWCVVSQVEPGDCAGFNPVPRHFIAYHYVCAGEMLLQVEGEAPVRVAAGDIVMLPRNDAHRLGSDTRLKPLPAAELVQPPGEGAPLARLAHGEGTPAAHFFCGFLAHDHPDDPLLVALPRVLRLGVANTTTGQWIESSLRFAALGMSAGEDVSPARLGRLAELLFVEAVRQYLRDPDAPGQGWLAGLRDPMVGQALALMHGQRERAWTTETLAREVGLSRSAFAERFTGLVGEPPMRYLSQWRLRQAARRLVETSDPIARIASDAGYESEPAFHRAFKRAHQTTPAGWRKRHAPAGPA
jgi:AraC-like DNA-binding protein